jgi:sulfur carrier protein
MSRPVEIMVGCSVSTANGRSAANAASVLTEHPTLVESHPVQIILNGQPRDVSETTTIAELLESLGLAGKYVAVEVNREVIPRARHADRRLAPGDTLEIVTLVGGG